ncbi:N-acetylglucosamine-6-phosphate deacetylase [uncultured Corynebacterium sp.]|uniref:N-acetylglucosamine-6-phosphate deacetylase n=1 Tax=uncultured Corynebacterium sp. TaxID=159447 RepID=UPI0025E4D16E|nr:amidohydrolase family protein [uncultured Corynebacterium sp.]
MKSLDDACADPASGFLRGRIVTPDGVLDDAVVSWADGVITEVRAVTGDESTSQSIAAADDAAAPLVLPGLIDVHDHGALGHEFPGSDAAGCAIAAGHHRRHGTTTLLASTVSAAPDVLARQVAVLADVADNGIIDGIHLEGPFLNACRCGAQDPAAIVPGDPAVLEPILAAARGHMRTITLAPETARLDELLDVCADHGIVASLGHTDADYAATAAAIAAAVDRGVPVTATHLFNAMPRIHHRDPGAAAALLAAAVDGDATVELIADGVHLSDAIVDLVRATVGPDGIALVSDAMAAAGMPDGDYVLGRLPVVVADGVARLRTDDGEPGAIAGGTSTILDQVNRLRARGVDLADVARMAATTGARAAGFPDRGAITVGKRADLLVCSDTPTGALTPRTVIVAGAAQKA